MLIELFARKEKSIDQLVGAYFKNKHDIAIYRDRICTIPIGRFLWYYSKPRIGQKRIMLNCCHWKLTWV